MLLGTDESTNMEATQPGTLRWHVQSEAMFNGYPHSFLYIVQHIEICYTKKLEICKAPLMPPYLAL